MYFVKYTGYIPIKYFDGEVGSVTYYVKDMMGAVTKQEGEEYTVELINGRTVKASSKEIEVYKNSKEIMYALFKEMRKK